MKLLLIKVYLSLWSAFLYVILMIYLNLSNPQPGSLCMTVYCRDSQGFKSVEAFNDLS